MKPSQASSRLLFLHVNSLNFLIRGNGISNSSLTLLPFKSLSATLCPLSWAGVVSLDELGCFLGFSQGHSESWTLGFEPDPDFSPHIYYLQPAVWRCGCPGRDFSMTQHLGLDGLCIQLVLSRGAQALQVVANVSCELRCFPACLSLGSANYLPLMDSNMLYHMHSDILIMYYSHCQRN